MEVQVLALDSVWYHAKAITVYIDDRVNVSGHAEHSQSLGKRTKERKEQNRKENNEQCALIHHHDENRKPLRDARLKCMCWRGCFMSRIQIEIETCPKEKMYQVSDPSHVTPHCSWSGMHVRRRHQTEYLGRLQELTLRRVEPARYALSPSPAPKYTQPCCT